MTRHKTLSIVIIFFVVWPKYLALLWIILEYTRISHGGHWWWWWIDYLRSHPFSWVSFPVSYFAPNFDRHLFYLIYFFFFCLIFHILFQSTFIYHMIFFSFWQRRHLMVFFPLSYFYFVINGPDVFTTSIISLSLLTYTQLN